jgi:hypothetical protein
LQCQLLALILSVREGKFEQPPLPQQMQAFPPQYSQAQFVQSSPSVPFEGNGIARNGQDVNWNEILKIIAIMNGEQNTAPVSSGSNGGLSRQQFDYEM